MIGGSLALALRARRPDWVLRVWARRPESAAEALELGAADAATVDLATCVTGAACIVLCTPIDAMRGLAEKFTPFLRPDAVVTDAGSVKAAVVHQLEAIIGPKYVGAHPIAGSEKTGIRAATDNLFEGAPCVVTPTPHTDPAARVAIRDFWSAVGCRVTEMSPEEHDAVLARSSHLPHAVAATLVHTVAGNADSVQQWTGGGYRDTTRIAAGSPDMWTDILLSNRREVLAALDDYRDKLANLRDCLERSDANCILRFLSFAKRSRDQLSNE